MKKLIVFVLIAGLLILGACSLSAEDEENVDEYDFTMNDLVTEPCGGGGGGGGPGGAPG